MTLKRHFHLMTLCLFFPSIVWATATPSVEEIINKANLTAYYQGNDGRAQVQMLIIDAQGRKRQRSFSILRRDLPQTDALTYRAYWGEQQFYVYFNRPSDVNKMVFMVHKKIETDDDRWLYLPALDLVKRIAATDKRTSFVGSDYFYEDVSGRSIEADHHILLEETPQHYIIKGTPKAPDTVEFNYYLLHVDKTTFIPVKTEYYDHNDEQYRIATVLKTDIIQGYPTVTEASMENLKSGSKTLIRYKELSYDIGLPEDIFTERFLRTPPQQYLR